MENKQYPMAIITSDVHLGGGNTKSELFKQFLLEIKMNIETDDDYKHTLKYLIFLGDIFDLLMTSYERIYHEFKQILVLMDQIEKNGVKLLFILGNHEVSVSGDYDEKSVREKINFLLNFKEVLKEKGFNVGFLNKRNFCQFALINENRKEKKWYLDIYDANHQIHNEMPNNLSPLFLGDIKGYGQENVLKRPKIIHLSHGYQFFGTATQISGALVWDNLLHAKPETKIKINEYYNVSGLRDLVKKAEGGPFKNIDTKDIVKQWSNKERERIQNGQVSFKNHIQKEMSQKKGWKEKLVGVAKGIGNTIKDEAMNAINFVIDYLGDKSNMNVLVSMAQADDELKKMEKFEDHLKKISKFIKQAPFDDLGITHVIYGHTHQSHESEIEDLKIFNDGAWQHTEHPHYISLYPSGKIELKEYKK